MCILFGSLTCCTFQRIILNGQNLAKSCQIQIVFYVSEKFYVHSCWLTAKKLFHFLPICSVFLYLTLDMEQSWLEIGLALSSNPHLQTVAFNRHIPNKFIIHQWAFLFTNQLAYKNIHICTDKFWYFQLNPSFPFVVAKCKCY